MPLPSRTRFSHVEYSQPGVVELVGNFTFNGSSQPDAAEGKPFNPLGTDFVRNGAGDYTLTIPGSGLVDVLAFTCQLEDTTKILIPIIVARTDASRTIQLKFYDLDGTPTATDPTDGAILHVRISVKNRPI